jgi:hypothetical protein
MYPYPISTSVQLVQSTVYLVVQGVKQDGKIYCEATHHCYLLAFSKPCYKSASLETIYFAPSMVQLLVHGTKLFSKSSHHANLLNTTPFQAIGHSLIWTRKIRKIALLYI